MEEMGVVDERRHNNILHMPFVISRSNLLEKIKARLPENTQFQPLSWLKLNFQPTCPQTMAAMNYTGKFKGKKAVQQCLLRSQHEDAGYASHQFNMKEMVCKNCDSCELMVKQSSLWKNQAIPFELVPELTTGPCYYPGSNVSWL